MAVDAFSKNQRIKPNIFSSKASSFTSFNPHALTEALTLDFLGNSASQFVFQIGSTLTTASGSSVVSVNTGNGPTPGCEVYWQVGCSATLGTTTAFQSHILALTSITLNTGVTIDGSALVRNGAVTLDENRITNTHCEVTATSESVSMTLALVGGLLVGLPGLRKKLRGKKQDARSVVLVGGK